MPGTDGAASPAAGARPILIKAGTVFTIGTGVTAVKALNPVTKAVLPFQQQFTVMADVTAAAGAATLPITPPIIPVGDRRRPAVGHDRHRSRCRLRPSRSSAMTALPIGRT